MGGVGRWTERFLAAAPAHGLLPTLLNIAPPVGNFSEKSAFRVDRLRPALAGLAQLAALLAKRQVDLVHVTTTLFWATPREALVLAMCKSAGVPTILHVHSGNQIISWRDGLATPQRTALDAVLRQARQVVVLSNELQAYLERALPGLPVVRIANPVELAEPAPGPDVFPPRHRRRTRVLFVGAVTPKKGVAELAEAVLALPNVELAMIGALGEALDAREAQRMRAALDALRAERRLLEVGEKTPEEVLRAYRESDIFCLPSHREGLPNVLLEAMVAGRACVATPVGGIPEVLEGVGLLVPVGDVAALTSTLQELARDPERRAHLGALAHARAVATCGTPVVMAQYRSLYEALLTAK
jgi:glycosyltransferase involved in cell wall biosynthesis